LARTTADADLAEAHLRKCFTVGDSAATSGSAAREGHTAI